MCRCSQRSCGHIRHERRTVPPRPPHSLISNLWTHFWTSNSEFHARQNRHGENEFDTHIFFCYKNDQNKYWSCHEWLLTHCRTQWALPQVCYHTWYQTAAVTGGIPWRTWQRRAELLTPHSACTSSSGAPPGRSPLLQRASSASLNQRRENLSSHGLNTKPLHLHFGPKFETTLETRNELEEMGRSPVVRKFESDELDCAASVVAIVMWLVNRVQEMRFKLSEAYGWTRMGDQKEVGMECDYWMD